MTTSAPTIPPTLIAALREAEVERQRVAFYAAMNGSTYSGWQGFEDYFERRYGAGWRVRQQRWENGACACGYCTGRIVHKREKTWAEDDAA